MNNRGKQFEAHIQQAFERVPDCVAWRLKDQIGRYRNVSNPCDFFFYKRPVFYAIECKSVKGASLPFTNVRPQEQIYDLHDLAQNDGVVAGFIIWFIDKDITVFVHHDVIYQAYERGKKSIALKDILQLPSCEYHIIDGVKKRLYFTYDVTSFLEKDLL